MSSLWRACTVLQACWLISTLPLWRACTVLQAACRACWLLADSCWRRAHSHERLAGGVWRDGRPAAATRAKLMVCVSSRRAFVTQCAALPARQREQRARLWHLADDAAASLPARWRMSGAAPKGAMGATMERKGEDHRSKNPTTLFFKKSWSRTTICRQLPVLERAT